MKKILLTLILSCSVVFLSYAQTSQGISYQAVVRDAAGKVLPNAPVSIKLALVSENKNIEAYYTEVHEVTTDFLGQVSLNIGEGKNTKGVFNQIPWGQEQIWLDVDLVGEKNNLKINSRTQLLSVPYALHAATTSQLVTDEQAVAKAPGQSIYWLTGGNFGTVPATHFFGTRDNKELVLKTNNQRLLSFKTNGQTQVTGRVTGEDKSKDSYPLTITGSNQGIYIKVIGKRNNDNNFVTFADDEAIWGRIEGETWSEKEQTWEYKLQVALFVLEGAAKAGEIAGVLIEGAGHSASIFGIGAGVASFANAVALGIEAAALLAESITWGVKIREDIGVSYASGNGDYAEWLKRAEGERDINYGEIVGVKGGLVSLNTAKADNIFVVSHRPAVIGNGPQESERANYEKVSFMGQVPVKVAGPVAVGDFIVASGNNDGFGVAIHPKNMKTGDYTHSVGIAWEAAPDRPINMVKIAVGINTNDLSSKVDQLNKSIDNITAYLEGKAPLLDEEQLSASPNASEKPTTTFNKRLTDEEFDQLVDQNAGTFKFVYAQAKIQLQQKGYDLAAFPQIAEFLDNPIPTVKALRRDPTYFTQWALVDANFKNLKKGK